MSREPSDEIRATRHELEAHLALWGLQRFTSDEAYFLWQRQVLSPRDLSTLQGHVEKKRHGATSDEVAFYDATADPHILPVLYSQRYDYYLALGPGIAARISDARTVLDFGCGVGILTTFYAKQFPAISFVGVDRSPLSIERARERSKTFGLQNVRFDCFDIIRDPLPGFFDLVIATHALVQAEQDPGLPSRDWRTFERQHDPAQQRSFEARTGIGPRLDGLCVSLTQDGRLVLFEKTRQLSRRVPFQRALAARRLSLVERPEPIRYCVVEEVAEDGPLYVLQLGEGRGIAWDEHPEPDEGRPFDPSSVGGKAPIDDEPLYENHYPSAQQAWERLRGRSVIREETKSEQGGRQLHAELGRAEEGSYLYCANTFDQRQLVLVQPARVSLIEEYYRDIVGSPRR